MIKRYLLLEKFVRDVIMRKKRSTHAKFLLNDDEIEVCHCLVVVLGPFKMITKQISGNKLII
jgi:hypothetical protein